MTPPTAHQLATEQLAKLILGKWWALASVTVTDYLDDWCRASLASREGGLRITLSFDEAVWMTSREAR